MERNGVLKPLSSVLASNRANKGNQSGEGKGSDDTDKGRCQRQL
jgi:hypothetical protein